MRHDFNGEKKFEDFICIFFVKSRRKSPIFGVFQIFQTLKTSNFQMAVTGKRFNSATRNSGIREIFVQIFYWSKKISRFIMQIFRKIASNIADLTSFKYFLLFKFIKKI